MKKIFFLFSIAALFILIGCKNKTSDYEETDIPNGMMVVDLSSHGLPLVINLPDSSLGSHEIKENALGGIDVKAGKNFQISIIEGAGNFDMKRSDIETDAVRKLVKYLINEPTTLYWEWQIEGLEPEYHFYTVIHADDKSFEVQDIEGEIFSENAIAKMLESAKSIRIKSTTEAN
ncbi:MAG TPA: hypothetical protein VFL70_03865 [Bacteroidia bacterium]|nr:hypothetical protein [Bacteroidia bacterium]